MIVVLPVAPEPSRIRAEEKVAAGKRGVQERARGFQDGKRGAHEGQRGAHEGKRGGQEGKRGGHEGKRGAKQPDAAGSPGGFRTADYAHVMRTCCGGARG